MNKIIIIAGPTAVGKTEYSIEISKAFDGEIVSSDSMQLYKYMDIGSAKPTREELSQVKHYLVDRIDPAQKFSVAEYQKLALEAIDEIRGKGKIPVISGGTGLYINSIIYDMDFAGAPSDEAYRKKLYEIGMNEGGEALHRILAEKDPQAAARIHPNNIKKLVRAIEAAEAGDKVKDFATELKPREGIKPLMIGLTRDREELYDRINRRVDILVELGLIDEVRKLMDMGLDADDISMKGIGYKEIIGYLKGEYSLEDAVELVKKNTRHYAKRQLTWLRRYDNLQWFNLSEYASKEQALGDMITWLKNR